LTQGRRYNRLLIPDWHQRGLGDGESTQNSRKYRTQTALGSRSRWHLSVRRRGRHCSGSRHLDLLGIMVLSFATAMAGGVIRDLLIGAVPPAAFKNWLYSVVAFSAAVFVFLLHRIVAQVPGNLIMVLDAVGLALFAVAGTEKALAFNIHPFIAILMGTITGVGGGVVRDVLLAQVPSVLRTDVYATAAMAGCGIVILCRTWKVPPIIAAVAGGVCCFVLRVTAALLHWNLPRVMEQ
jgi:uncharacterized membrane protein YeiH